MNDLACGKDTIDNYSSWSGTAVNGIKAILTTSSNTVWINPTPIGQNTADEPSEGDIFKQIVSLLGIKIANVKIDNGSVVIYGCRRKKKYIIEITGRSIVVKNEKGNQISEIFLSIPYADGDYIQQPYIVYPQPGTAAPNIYPYTQPYTGGPFTITNADASVGTYTIASGDSTIIGTNEVVNV